MNKYKFLNNKENKVIYLLAKSRLNYSYIKNLSPKKTNLFLNLYIKKLIKLNENNNINIEREVLSEDVNTIFRFKKHKINLNSVLSKLEEIENINVFYYPDTKDVLKEVNKKYKLSKLYNLCTMLLCLLVLGSSVFYLFNWNKDNNKTKKLNARVAEDTKVNEAEVKKEEFLVDDYEKYLNYSLLDVDFNKLKQENKDTKAWISVNNTNINYPVVQASDNDYYLKHSYDKSVNKKGWIFIDFRNNIDNPDKNNIIYAHGLTNNMMLGSMRKTLKKEWYKNKDNHIIKVSTPNTYQLWQVFSNYTIEPEEYYITTDFSGDEFYYFINKLKSRSIYDYKVNVNADDKILTLSSCYDNTRRMVLHAKLIYYEKR